MCRAAGRAISGQDRHGRSGGHLDGLMGFCRKGGIAGRWKFATANFDFVNSRASKSLANFMFRPELLGIKFEPLSPSREFNHLVIHRQ